MAKITIKHFVNKDLKPIIESNKTKYPVYVQVIVLTRTLKFKSNNKFFEYLAETDLSTELANEADLGAEFIKKVLEGEREHIERIVCKLIEKDKKEFITSKYLGSLSRDLIDITEENFSVFLFKEAKKEGVTTIPTIFHGATFSEINSAVKFLHDYSEIITPIEISIDVTYCLIAIGVVYDNISVFDGRVSVYDFMFEDEIKQKIKETIDRIPIETIDYLLKVHLAPVDKLNKEAVYKGIYENVINVFSEFINI